MLIIANLNISTVFSQKTFLRIPVLAATFLFASFQASSLQTTQTDANYYEEGKTLLENDRVSEAISIWEEAYEELSEPDYRIGQAYLSIVAAQKMNGKYKKASEIYTWGLQGSFSDHDREFLLDELDYLEPLISRDQKKILEEKVKNSDNSIFNYLDSFWGEEDPTPLTDYNERLIEHWRRVAYCKENFTYSSKQKLDDRAEIYIRYGDPYYRKSGELIYNSGTVSRLLEARLYTRINEESITADVKNTAKFNLETNVRQMHGYPRFDVWVYESLTDNIRSTVFLFGSEDGSDNFKRKNSLEDFIPRSAYRTYGEEGVPISNQSNSQGGTDRASNSIGQGNQSVSSQVPAISITPALLFQIMYYEQFAAIDEYFGNAYENMLSTYSDRSARISKSLVRQFESSNSGRLIAIQRSAPDKFSQDANGLMSLSLDSHHYRFLNENNEPYVKIFAITDASDAILYNQLAQENRITQNPLKNYQLRTGVLALNGDEEKPTLIQEDDTPVRTSMDVTPHSIFDVKYEKNDDRLLKIAGQLIEEDSTENTFHQESSFEESTRALASKDISVPESLNTNEIEISDIIIGYPWNGEHKKQEFVPFKISHDYTIPEGRNLNLYYEIYNLEENENGNARFKLNYQVKEESRFFDFLRKTEDPITVTLENEIPTDRYEQVLEIETSDFEPGTYNLNFSIEDEVANTVLERQYQFVIE